MDDAEIDAERRDADLGMDLPAPGFERRLDRVLERRLGSTARSARTPRQCALAPRSANSRKCLKSRTPRALVRTRSICSGRSVAKTTSSRRARVIATFSRRWPPSWFSELELRDTRPVSSGPTATENRITSRSSPCTFSRFLTKTGSCQRTGRRRAPAPDRLRRSWSSRFSISRCCSPLKVTMPIERFSIAKVRLLEPAHDIGDDGCALPPGSPCRCRARRRRPALRHSARPGPR